MTRRGKYHCTVVSRPSAQLMEALAAVAPGTGLREGIDRILQANMGALIVVGDGPEVLNICSGGFLLDAAFSPQRLERYRDRLDGVTASLSALEVEDLVTVRDVVNVLQRTEMVRRIADEIAGDIVELGVDGRLVKLQLEELMGGVEDERRMVMLDFFTDEREWHLDQGMDALAAMGTEELLDSKAVGATLHLPGNGVELDTNVQPRGYRLLSRIPRLPDAVIERIVNRFGTLQKIMRATIDDLDDVTGVGQSRARAIKEGLSRLAETSILDRYS